MVKRRLILYGEKSRVQAVIIRPKRRRIYVPGEASISRIEQLIKRYNPEVSLRSVSPPYLYYQMDRNLKKGQLALI